MMNWGNVALTFTRNYRKIPWKRNRVKYALVSYYPRPNEPADPEFTPSKLLMIQRVKPYKGNPYWEKQVLDILGLGEDELGEKIAIVKNIPEVCAQLWSIKHLIKVTAIELPEKALDESDIGRTWLDHNGKVWRIPKVDAQRYEAAVQHATNKKRFDRKTITEQLRLLWDSGTLP